MVNELPNGWGVQPLEWDSPPVRVGVDYGTDDMTTECDVVLQPGGLIKVLDVRQTPAPMAQKGE